LSSAIQPDNTQGRIAFGYASNCAVAHERDLLNMTAQPTPLLLLASLALAAACGSSNPKSPGLEKMGSPGIAWSEKSYQQRLDFMAGVFHPKTQQLFSGYNPNYGKAGVFTCESCHGDAPELVNYKMPSPTLYALPKENTIQESMEYDAEVTHFMQDTLTPQVRAMFDKGAGPKTETSCFSCHPVDG
jgi:cytochrome c553